MSLNPVDVSLSTEKPLELLVEKHKKFLLKVSTKSDPTKDFLKMSGIYWCLTALDLMNAKDLLDKDAIIEFVKCCINEDGGISPAPLHDSHLLSTLSAVQILAIYDRIDILEINKVVQFVTGLQQSDGSFAGDKWLEIDTRFSFCALATLKLLGQLPPEQKDTILAIDLNKASDYLVKCQNADGGFGTRPGSESHAGQAYCVLGALSILQQLHRLDSKRASFWLAERQLLSGGLNGRPQKKPDVCYSWWVLSSLSMLGKINWINQLDLVDFILSSQDDELGGIADRPGDMPDPYHTLFGIAGVSLLARSGIDSSDEQTTIVKATKNHSKYDQELRDVLSYANTHIRIVNPVFCLPEYVIERLGLHTQML
ncbi:hypothetical protein Ciccas_000262 [Cichlidogyrus casuarinus]|uniref:Geranylgeranyl transferase type-2 subunit beta n=1 Tax=Cichlidogyrus casuarinus TaxID=1844966 RepID=A0ABD2QNG6_9PLAT